MVEKKRGLFNLRPLYDWFVSQLDGLYRIEVRKVRKQEAVEAFVLVSKVDRHH